MDTAIAEHIYKYTNALTLEFALFSFGVLGPVWNILVQKTDGTHVINRDGNRNRLGSESLYGDYRDGGTLFGQIPIDSTAQPRHRIVRVLKRSLLFVSEHSFIFSLPFVASVLGVHVYSEIDNYIKERSDVILEINGRNNTLTGFEKVNYYLQTVYTYAISILSFVAYIMVRHDCSSKWRFTTDNILLVLTGCGHVLFVIFETADSISGFLSSTDQRHLTEEIFYFIKVLFHYIGIYTQVMLLIRAQEEFKKITKVDQHQRRQIVKGIVIFLGVCNAERWLVDSFLSPINLRFVDEIQNDETLGERNWWFLTAFLFPVVTFYRLLSTLKFLEIKDRL